VGAIPRSWTCQKMDGFSFGPRRMRIRSHVYMRFPGRLMSGGTTR